MQRRRELMTLGGGLPNDTTAIVETQNRVLLHGAGDTYITGVQENGGITVTYAMDSAQTILYPCGLIPTTDNVIAVGKACMFIYDAQKNPIGYVNLRGAGAAGDRWAQNPTGTMTEYQNRWTASTPFSYIQVSVDMRYLDKAYMYDGNTGQVWFAGKNTPYYGMRNISESN